MLLLVRLVGKVVGEIPLADEQGGAAVARNKEFEMATSYYYDFVDSDDEIDKNYYGALALYEKAKETDAQVIKCERRTFESDGRT